MFLGAAAWFIHLAAPVVAPYRDAGEMTFAAWSLGVAHPPGYPAYVLAGKTWLALLPFGNAAYRLNLFSALAAAGVAALLFAAVRRNWKGEAARDAVGILAGSGLAAVFCSSRLVQSLAAVSEMYTLSWLVLALLLYLASDSPRKFGGACFLAGLGTGVRMDLLLALPGLYFLWPLRRRLRLIYGFLFLLGASVFLVLPVRSLRRPDLDWNSPRTARNLLAHLSRKTHGGTLDLISERYSAGEVLGPGFRHYTKALLKEATIPAMLLALAGFWHRPGLLLAWALTGPLFVFLARMPPNPHALAILEAHYPMSILLVLFSAGLLRPPTGRGAALLVGALLLLSVAWAAANRRDLRNRWNFWAHDFGRVALAELPREGVLVARKDVELFSLWHLTEVEGRRPDAIILGQGISASPWYVETLRRRRNFSLPPLKTPEGWRRLFVFARPVYLSPDLEMEKLPPDLEVLPHGLLWRIGGPPDADSAWRRLAELSSFRERPRVPDSPDFFREEISERIGSSYARIASSFLKEGRLSSAEEAFRIAAEIQPEDPMVWRNLGYIALRQNRFGEAVKRYRQATLACSVLSGKAEIYRALPEVRADLRRLQAETWNDLSSAYERAGDPGQAEDAARRAIALKPDFGLAHYNLGVALWKQQRWREVREHFRRALELDPQLEQARRYLNLLRERERP